MAGWISQQCIQFYINIYLFYKTFKNQKFFSFSSCICRKFRAFALNFIFLFFIEGFVQYDLSLKSYNILESFTFRLNILSAFSILLCLTFTSIKYNLYYLYNFFFPFAVKLSCFNFIPHFFNFFLWIKNSWFNIFCYWFIFLTINCNLTHHCI